MASADAAILRQRDTEVRQRLNPSPEEIEILLPLPRSFRGRSALWRHRDVAAAASPLGNGSIRSTCHIKILKSRAFMTFSAIFNSEPHPGLGAAAFAMVADGRAGFVESGSRIKPPVAI